MYTKNQLSDHRLDLINKISNRSHHQIYQLYELVNFNYHTLLELEAKIKKQHIGYCPSTKEEVENILNMTKPKKENFDVLTYSIHNTDELKSNKGYCHWAKDLNMIIEKDGTRVKLNSEEIKKIAASLPRTVGGSYN